MFTNLKLYITPIYHCTCISIGLLFDCQYQQYELAMSKFKTIDAYHEDNC